MSAHAVTSVYEARSLYGNAERIPRGKINTPRRRCRVTLLQTRSDRSAPVRQLRRAGSAEKWFAQPAGTVLDPGRARGPGSTRGGPDRMLSADDHSVDAAFPAKRFSPCATPCSLDDSPLWV